MQRVRVVISGRVQGVFFRSAVADEAERLGLSGWVRNRSDGRVEAELQGEEAAVDQALELCRTGPDRAEVNDIRSEKIDPVDGDVCFSVR